MSNINTKIKKPTTTQKSGVSARTAKSGSNKPISLKKTTDVRLSDDTLVKVMSNCFGKLIWVAKDGYKTIWDNHGDEQELTIKELREMKSSSSRFFSDNWIIITGFAHGKEVDGAATADIYKTLGVSKFYGDLVNPEGYKDIAKWTEKEIKTRVGNMTQGAKENLIIAVQEQYSEGEIDSVKTIETFEEVLGCKIEKSN